MLRTLLGTCCSLVLWGCGSGAPAVVQSAPITVPSVEHGVSVPVSAFAYIGESVTPEQVESHLSTESVEAIPAKLTAPGMLVVSPTAITWMGSAVVTLNAGALPEEAMKGYLATALYDRVLSSVESTKEARQGFGLTDGSFKALLLVDVSVPMKTVNSVLYTLGQAQISEFAYVVTDATPAATRSDAAVGGSSGHGALRWTDDEIQWIVNGLPPVTMPRNTPMSKVLDTASPPGVAISASNTMPFGELAAMQDALAAEGVYCVTPATGAPDEGSAATTPDAPATVSIDPAGSVTVHILKLPALAMPGQAEPKPDVRMDGSQCMPATLMIRAQPRPALQGIGFGPGGGSKLDLDKE